MINELELFNVGPFKGKHHITLGPGSYAIVARHEDEPHRSNAVGKSMLVEAIGFALMGDFPKTRGFDSDGWISRGEREGYVRLVLEGGAEIKRSKKLGQSTQLVVTLPGLMPASQKAAQEKLLKWLEFTEEDYLHTCYFEQKEAARLLRADPADRLAIISSWLGLGLADKAEELASEISSERYRLVEELTQRVAVNSNAPSEPIDLHALHLLNERRAKAEREMKRAEEQKKMQEDAHRADRVMAAHHKRMTEGKELQAWVNAYEASIEAEHTRATEKSKKCDTTLSLTISEYQSRKKVAAGMFDGQCPIASLKCPAKDLINDDRVVNKAMLDRASKAYQEAADQATNARGLLSSATATHHELVVKRARLKTLRAEVKENADDVRRAGEILDYTRQVVGVDERYETALSELNRIVYECGAAEQAHKMEKARVETLEIDRAKLDLASKAHRTAHRAKLIFRTARRRVAERALADVEADANEAIQAAGVDLSLSCRWEKEGKKLALECEECGAHFPASEKIKECKTCGLPRGMRTTSRLDFIRSDSSGGFDDLVGTALQLSAGAWLLHHRASPWATCLLDEVTAAQDASVRKGLVRYLTSITRRSSFRQLLLVSHSTDTVDAMPRRITIIRAKDGARRIEVT